MHTDSYLVYRLVFGLVQSTQYLVAIIDYLERQDVPTWPTFSLALPSIDVVFERDLFEVVAHSSTPHGICRNI